MGGVNEVNSVWKVSYSRRNLTTTSVCVCVRARTVNLSQLCLEIQCTMPMPVFVS